MSEKDLQDWVKRLSSVELPVLSGVMKEINAVTVADESSANHLAEIILKDASLTSKVLRIANSAYHKPGSNNEITTISRAVVQLGFKGIKAICLSVMMIDSLLQKHTKERMLEWMARGFHTAVQSEGFITNKGGNDDDREEVFITALLLHMGDMAFWSAKGAPQSDQLDKLLNRDDFDGDSDALEREILGATLKEISMGLAKEWNMGDEVIMALEPGHKPNDKTKSVLLGEKVSLAAEQGWDSEAFNEVLIEASMFTGKGLEDIRQQVMDGADKAAAVAVNYGANKICPYIPSTTESFADRKPKVLKADPQLQLDVLREIGAMVQQNVDVNTLFQMVVEGIHRGIGLERVVLCLVDPKVTMMQPKYLLGEGTEQLREKLVFPVKSDQDNIFAHCIHSRKTLRLTKEEMASYRHLFDSNIEKLINTDQSIMAAVYTPKRSIGLLFADRADSGISIDNEQFESFSHFIQQTNMSLAMLANQRG